MSSDQGTTEIERVDLPLTVPPKMAEEMATELEETGSINVTVERQNVPDIVDQIRWQLENNEQLTEITDSYDCGDEI